MAEATHPGRDAGWMVVGTATMGVSGYVFLAAVGRSGLPGVTVAALASLYMLSNIVGPGVFVSVEHETSRLISTTLALDRRLAGVVRRTAVLSAMLAAVVVGVLTTIWPVLLDRALGDDVGLLGCLMLTVVGSAAVFWRRGVDSGSLHFQRYAASLCVDGGVRTIGSVGLMLTGSSSAVAYGLVLCVAPLVAALVVRSGTAARSRKLSEAPPEWATLGRAVALLLPTSLLMMVLPNLSAVLFAATNDDGADLAFAFSSAVVLTRIPLLLAGPLQAVMLPRMTLLYASSQFATIRRRTRQGVWTMVVIGVTMIGGAALCGEAVLRLVFGVRTAGLGPATLALLAASAAVLLAVAVVHPMLVATGRHSALVGGWGLGLAVLVAQFLLSGSGIDRAVAGQTTAPIAVLAVHLAAVRRSLGPRGRSGQLGTLDGGGSDQ